MLELDCLTEVEGPSLLALIDTIRRTFLARDSYEEVPSGQRRVNSVRLATIETWDGLSRSEQIAVVEDLLFGDQEIEFLRSQQTIFHASDSPAAHIVDLVCEVVWQALVREPEIRIEDEIRAAFAQN